MMNDTIRSDTSAPIFGIGGSPDGFDASVVRFAGGLPEPVNTSVVLGRWGATAERGGS